jgi:hypothetical protein
MGLSLNDNKGKKEQQKVEEPKTGIKEEKKVIEKKEEKQQPSKQVEKTENKIIDPNKKKNKLDSLF